MTEPLSRIEQQVIRGIETREHRKAVAERRAAQEAHRAKVALCPSPVGWCTKPPKKRKPTPSEQEIAKNARANHLAWARRNPAAAAAERDIRKSRAEMLDRWDHKAQGTPETHEAHSRQREGAMRRLYMKEVITGNQLAAATQIARMAEIIGADVSISTASLETRIDAGRRHDDAFYESLSRVRAEVAYTRWRQQLIGSAGPVLEMIVEDFALTIVAKRYRLSVKRTKRLLTDALDLWPLLHRDAKKEIDAATLAAAHAGILG